MPLEATLPPSDVNVPGDYFSMAGFEVTSYGRFWLLCRVPDYAERGEVLKVFKKKRALRPLIHSA